MTASASRLCPVCGYEMDEPPWDGSSPSDEICPSCGIQFGYDDSRLGTRKQKYDEWRARWIASGMRWYSAGYPRPRNWDPHVQLLTVLHEHSPSGDD